MVKIQEKHSWHARKTSVSSQAEMVAPVRLGSIVYRNETCYKTRLLTLLLLPDRKILPAISPVLASIPALMPFDE
jgi:hypothetical protein